MKLLDRLSAPTNLLRLLAVFAVLAATTIGVATWALVKGFETERDVERIVERQIGTERRLLRPDDKELLRRIERALELCRREPECLRRLGRLVGPSTRRPVPTPRPLPQAAPRPRGLAPSPLPPRSAPPAPRRGPRGPQGPPGPEGPKGESGPPAPQQEPLLDPAPLDPDGPGPLPPVDPPPLPLSP